MKYSVILLLIIISYHSNAQTNFNTNSEHPFGRANPEAPQNIMDYKELIGTSTCTSQTKKPDGTWSKSTSLEWSFKYIMNGMAIQDETWQEDGKHSGSIRQFDKDSMKWYVHFYTTTRVTPVLATWEGKRDGDKMVLYKEQKAPNGMDGFYRLTFSDISNKGFKWVGEWVDTTENVAFPTWKITCVKNE